MKTRVRVVFASLFALFAAVEITPRLYYPPGALRDTPAYLAVVARLRTGDDYYAALAAELRAHNYPTASIFNWRPPTLFRAIAAVPPAVPRVLLVALAIATLALTVATMRTQARSARLVAAVAICGALWIVSNPVAYVHHEIWSGILIAVSALLYTRRAWIGGTIAAVAALFVRELAAPYCIVCAGVAFRQRRMRELALWGAAAAAYSVTYIVHLQRLGERHEPDIRGLFGWFQWNGLRFIMETVQQTNSFLVHAPHWVLAAAITLVAAAASTSETPSVFRGLIIVYATLFAIAGDAFNDYWGFITAPAYAIAAGYGFDAIVTLWRNANAIRRVERTRSSTMTATSSAPASSPREP